MGMIVVGSNKREGVRVPGPVKKERRRSCAGSGRCFSKG